MKSLIVSSSTITASILVLTILLFCQSSVEASHWTHADQQSWPDGVNQCDGKYQSPIDIKTHETFFNESLNLKFLNYEQQTISFKATNNGHSIQFDYIGDIGSSPAITGTGLYNQVFRLAQFHFHWGSAKHIGSEHKINGRAFPVELHLVHYNSKFESLGKALESGEDGSVAVVGVFFQVMTHNPGFEVIGEMVTELQMASESTNLRDPIILKYLLPDNINKIFRYYGSLTTPPCTEGLIWLVLETPNSIGFDQFKKFLGVNDPKTGDRLVNNFRKIQNLNGRKVEASFVVENVNKGFVVHNSGNLIQTIYFIIFLLTAGLVGSSFSPYNL